MTTNQVNGTTSSHKKYMYNELRFKVSSCVAYMLLTLFHAEEAESNGKAESIITDDKFKLLDPDLFQQDSYVDGKWVIATSGKRFDVIGAF